MQGRRASQARRQIRYQIAKGEPAKPPSPLSDPIGAAKARRAKFAKQMAYDAASQSQTPWWYDRNRPLKG
jgi:hypothetical protein